MRQGQGRHAKPRQRSAAIYTRRQGSLLALLADTIGGAAARVVSDR